MNWVNALRPVDDTIPSGRSLALVAGMRPGQRLLLRPPAHRGRAELAGPVDRDGAAALGAVGRGFARDVADGTLRQLRRAPINYRGACCVADSAVLSRRWP